MAINGSSGLPEAVIWSPTGNIAVLQDDGGLGFSEAFGINALRQSVGFVRTSAGEDEATLWSANGTERNLNSILGPGWSNTEALRINNYKDIMGTGTYHGINEAFELLWVPKAGAADGGTYINSTNHAALAVALHPEHPSYSPHPG
jgi:hypothetical protein